jgi:hypothetical protein
VAPLLQQPAHRLPEGDRGHGPADARQHHVLPAARRRVLRPPEPPPFSSRSKEERALDLRVLAQTVREGSPVATRDQQGEPCDPSFRPASFKSAATVAKQSGTPASSPVVRNNKGKKEYNPDITKKQHHKAEQHLKPQKHKPQDNIKQLKFLFKQALQECNEKRFTLFLDLFAGVGQISNRLVKRGHASLAFEIDCGPHFDLLSRSVVKLLLGWINSGCISGVWLATPCTSWSRARHGPPHSGWCTIRTNKHIMGLPDLKPRDCDKISLGSRTMLVTARIIRLCIACHVPCFFENPASSMIWLAGPIQHLCKHSSNI